MRVLFIQKEGGIFGAEQFHLKTIPSLIKAGVEVSFLRLYTQYQLGIDSPFVGELKKMGVEVYQVDIGRFPGIRDLRAVKKVIKEGQFDLVHTHLIHADLYGALVKYLFLPKTKLVSTKHGFEESYNNEHGFDPSFIKKNLYYRINRFSEKQCNRSFSISDGLKNLFVQSGMSRAEKMSRIHYGFKMPETEQAKSPEEAKGSPQLVLAGRLVGFKGHRYAFQAVAKLKVKYPQVSLWVLGIGELEEELKAMCKTLDIEENVHFLGYKTNVLEYMEAADIVLIPSIAEGFGVVFLEAVNTLRPIAAFDVPAGNEIMAESYRKLLAKPFDVDQYVLNVEWILNNPEEMKQLTKDNKERLVNYFTIDRMVNEIVNFYKGTIAAD